MQTSAQHCADKARHGSSTTLTIDKGRLRDLFLPVEADHYQACARLWSMGLTARSRKRESERKALLIGYSRAKEYHDEVVEIIRERGGLLHIGAPRALQ